jgi:serine phosphatase RsbU (regulator of sigma subunit)/uncharacterized protein HemY
MKKLISLLFVVSFFCLKVHSQENTKIDSLQNLLINHRDDTVKVNLFLELAYLYNHKNIEEVLINATKALELSSKLNFEIGKAKSFLHIGNYYYYKSEYTTSLEFFKKSLKINKEINDKLAMSKSLNAIGVIYDIQGDYVQALEYYQKSLKVNEDIDNEEGISHALNNIGIIYDIQADYEQALIFYHKSLELDKKRKNDRDVSISLVNIGSIYTIQEKYDTAFSYFEQSLQIAKKIDYQEAIGENLYKIGFNYQEQKEYEKALDFFHRALTVNQKIGNQYTICSIYNSFGDVYLKKKEYKTALNYIQKSLEIANELELLDEVKTNHGLLARIYAATNKYQKAYENHLLFKALNDSIFNENNVRKLTGLEYQYKHEKEKQAIALEQAKKDAIQETETKDQNKIRNLLIMGILLAVLFVIAAVYGFVQKRKANTILAKQKLEIENTNEELNQINEELNMTVETVNQQKEAIEKTHQKTQASINYASRIQQALLPSQKLFSSYFPEHFILYKPKDIVSGDFYYFKKINEFLVIAVGDCTGHGVPGAFVSLLGIAFLNEIVAKKEIRTAAQVLEELRKQVKTSLKQTEQDNDSKDGMDIGLCIIDTKTNLLQFAGAYNPLYLIRNKELREIKGTKNPIGIHLKERPFENHQIQLESSDAIYLASDGFIDQFGGEKGMKFMNKKFKQLLLEINQSSFDKQKETLVSTLQAWKKDTRQIDDITVLGFKA